MSGATWNALAQSLRTSMEADEFALWIEPLQVQDDERALVLRCPNQFHLRWVRDNYLPRMRSLLSQLEPKRALELQVARSRTSPPTPPPQRQLELPGVDFRRPLLNRRFVFDSFVVGHCNEFACAAAKALAQGRQVYTNTMFLFSDTGLGKSHLTQAVGHQVLASQPRARVAYLTAEDFANQMVSALRKKRIQEFKDRFRRRLDVLLLEEVQFLAGKQKTQDELAYTLDFLLDAGKRVIFTGSCLPHKIKGLKSGLKSRLSAGITVPIDPPDHATRVRILDRLAREEGVSVDREVLEFLGQEVSGDVRRLRSALVGLLARSSLSGRPLDLSLAAEVVGHMVSRPSRVTSRQILAAVAKAYGLEEDQLTGKSRRRAVTRPRNLAMYLCRRHTDESYASIGKLFNRDHATVMYGVGQVERALMKEPKLPQEMEFLEKRLGLH